MKIFERIIGAIGILGLFYSIYLLVFLKGFQGLGALITLPLSLVLSIFFFNSFLKKPIKNSGSAIATTNRFSPIVVLGILIIIAILIILIYFQVLNPKS